MSAHERTRVTSPATNLKPNWGTCSGLLQCSPTNSGTTCPRSRQTISTNSQTASTAANSKETETTDERLCSRQRCWTDYYS